MAGGKSRSLVGTRQPAWKPLGRIKKSRSTLFIAAFWDYVVKAQDELIGFTGRTSPERLVLDRQIAAGYKDVANGTIGGHKPGGPWRVGKYRLFEGGTRIPSVVHWPAKVKPGVTDAIVSQVDFCASFGALAGQRPDTKTLPDSVNVLPALLGEPATGRDQVIEHANGLPLRQGIWKFIPPGKVQDKLGPWSSVLFAPPGALFDLEKDPR